jgi:Nif-specific regulatory protein
MVSDLLSRKISELTALYEVSRALASSLDLKVTTSKAFDVLADTLGLRRGTLVLRDREAGVYCIRAAHGMTKEEMARGRYELGEGITGKVLEKGVAIIVPDVGKEPRFLNRTKARDLSRQNLSFLCVPIKVGGEMLGAISVDRIFADDNVALEEDVRFLTVLASMIGQAVKLAWTVEKERAALLAKNAGLAQELKARYRLANVVGGSGKMKAVYEVVDRVAPTKSTVLIRGESGTGKELIARALHYNSPRAEKPFVRVSCAALPESLLESELFGHEKGAFTGAVEARKGRFELADGGTLFLDEIGDISPATQVKLLRVLQERKFERVGGVKTLAVDVRVIAATNRDLELALRQHLFREDLYYRLNVIPIFLPPLREREEDMDLLIEHFLARFNDENGKQARLSPAVLERLRAYSWPGNVRELENCIERLVVLSRGDMVEPEDLPLSIREGGALLASPSAVPAGGTALLPQALADIEKAQILDALRKSGGVQLRAAKLLGYTTRQLGYKIRKYGIEPHGLA